MDRTPTAAAPAAAPRADARATLHVAFVGEVDHGKSTLLGRILHDTGAISADRLTASVHEGGLAFLLDGLSEERTDLFTLDTVQARVEDEHRDYVLIDVPGHVELLKNMVTGASRADLGVVVVDASQRTRAQTRRHIHILRMLGVTACVCAVNKMDLVSGEEAFAAVAAEVAGIAAEAGLTLAATVPVSALEGDNVVHRGTRAAPWYDGPPLLSVLHRTGVAREGDATARFVVQLVRPGADGTHRVMGRVENGSVHAGQSLVAVLSGNRVAVRSVERFGSGPQPTAVAGDSVGLSVTGAPPAPGDVLAAPDAPPVPGTLWSARLLNVGEHPLRPGQRVTVHHPAGSVPGRIERVLGRWESANLSPVPGDTVLFSEFADILVRLEQPLPMELPERCPALGRFMLALADGEVAGPGIVTGNGGEDR